VNSLRRDVGSAYLAAGSRLISGIVITGLVYRRLGAPSFALLALVRTTIGLLNHTTLGLAPATVRMLAVESEDRPAIYSSAAALAALSTAVATFLAAAYAIFFKTIHVVPASLAGTPITAFVALMGMGTVLRLAGEPFGAALQVRGSITLDNLLLTACEAIGLSLSFILIGMQRLNGIGQAWFLAGAALCTARLFFANRAMGKGALHLDKVRGVLIRQLLTFGLLVALAQAADFLYAPTDNILINRFISPLAVAIYAPAIQIDAGLLLLVGGLAAVLLPHSALAHGAGELHKVRRYYITGTLLSLALLIPAAALVWLAAGWLLRHWLGNDMPATQAILPLVLIHTVVGGSSAVGRSILLAIGKVRPFTVAVLTAGAANVALSFIFVRYAGWGLRGIVLGTILAVIGRCAFWTPWFVLRSLRANPSISSYNAQA
jgi:O-antigen/teichoic acid export membrane protein